MGWQELSPWKETTKKVAYQMYIHIPRDMGRERARVMRPRTLSPREAIGHRCWHRFLLSVSVQRIAQPQGEWICQGCLPIGCPSHWYAKKDTNTIILSETVRYTPINLSLLLWYPIAAECYPITRDDRCGGGHGPPGGGVLRKYTYPLPETRK